MKFISHSPEETKALARAFIETLSAREDAATVVGLYGDLGSGKTAFSQAVAETLGVADAVVSPTFVIMKMYKIPDLKQGIFKNAPFKNIIHIDAYRLEGEREMLHLGFEEIIKNKENLILIEWPEKISGIMPRNHIRINFSFVDENTRIIENISVDENGDGEMFSE